MGSGIVSLVFGEGSTKQAIKVILSVMLRDVTQNTYLFSLRIEVVISNDGDVEPLAQNILNIGGASNLRGDSNRVL